MSIDTGHSEPIAPVVVAQRRQRDLGLPRFAVAQDQEASSGHTFRQHIAAQGCGGQRRKPRVPAVRRGLLLALAQRPACLTCSKNNNIRKFDT